MSGQAVAGRKRVSAGRAERARHDALRARVEAAIPAGAGRLLGDVRREAVFFRWCVWFGLPAHGFGKAGYAGAWTAAQVAWDDNIRSDLTDAVMRRLLPGDACNYLRSMSAADIEAVVEELESLLDVSFAALLSGEDAGGDS